jgi:phytoene dehydrogenase-like protein
MTVTADIIVAGAGHNSLITAAYLAKAGYEVVVLEARDIPGGGAVTEELLGAGTQVDTCSTGHTLILVNPLIKDDELGLVSDFGLRYVQPDPVAHVVLPDGEPFTMWLDIDKTHAEFARFSRRDADAYLRMIAEYDEVSSIIGSARFRPVGLGPSVEEQLSAHPHGSRWLRRGVISAADVIRHEFESPHVQAFMGWIAGQTAVPLDAPGSGTLAYSIVAGRQANSWSIPVGGSGKLTDGLVAYLDAHGATVVCNSPVERLILDDGRCVGVRTDDGTEYRARQAVVSTIHVKHLVEMAERETWGDDFVYGVDTYDPGIAFFAGYLTATEAPVFSGHHGPQSAVSAGLGGWLEDLIQDTRDIRDGKYVREPAFLLAATPTLVDPGRSPDGIETVKVVSFNTYNLPEGGASRWDAIKEEHMEVQLERLRNAAPNFTPDVVTGSLVKSPLDIERNNRHMVAGAPHGGDRGLAFSGRHRPVPGWAAHRMPIPGLYQTGGTTHPGGSITGAPGRNAAVVLLQDLGRDPGDVMGVNW